jgi:hypothetical protein
MDYPALDLGHKHASRTTLALVDLDVHIWGLEEIAGSTLPIGVVVSMAAAAGLEELGWGWGLGGRGDGRLAVR